MTAPQTLLLVEDSDTQALQFRLLLEGDGVSVDRTVTAEAALDRLNEALPDLLVVDYRLPGMNGDELVRRLRGSARTRTLPILMLTDEAAPDVERQGLDSGANAYVPKSGDRAVLLGRLRALLRQRRETAPDGAPEATGGADFRRPLLRVIEESATFRLFLSHLLTAEGFDVDATPDATSPGRTPADAVLVGLDAHGYDALALVRSLAATRATEGHEVVGLGGDGAALRAFEAGADDVLPRNGDRETLALRIRALVRRKLARDDEARAADRQREQAASLAHARAEAEAADALARANRDLADTNRRLEETQAQLVQAAKMASLGELVAGIAHEINNPLAFIAAHQATVSRLVGEAVAGDPAGLPRAAARLDAMGQGLARIRDLVIKLRRFSRMDEGEAANLDVPRAIDSVVALLAPKLGDGIRVTRRYEAPPGLVAPPALIDQVVMNILSNAADVLGGTGGIGGEIGVETDLVDGRYRIRIGDSGPGVPESARARIFEPFFTTKAVGQGTGLGLAISYGVVRANGGTIEVGTSPLGGALFTILVPDRRPA